MNHKNIIKVLFASIAMSVYLIGCGGGSSSSRRAPAPEQTPPPPAEIVTPTVAEALSDYPESIISDFAISYPMVTAAEIFKRVDFRDDADGISFWGIEGLSRGETLEIEAVFNTDLSLHEEGQGNLLESLPVGIMASFDALYPGAEVEELASSLEDGELAYAILFVLDGEELEVNLDANGEFDSLENVLEESEVPQVISDVTEAQNVDMPEVEFEEVTHADDSLSYVVEYENDDGESISCKLNSDGDILQIDWEGPLEVEQVTDTVAQALRD